MLVLPGGVLPGGSFLSYGFPVLPRASVILSPSQTDRSGDIGTNITLCVGHKVRLVIPTTCCRFGQKQPLFSVIIFCLAGIFVNATKLFSVFQYKNMFRSFTDLLRLLCITRYLRRMWEQVFEVLATHELITKTLRE